MKNKVAIILVNYNGFEDTKECVESLLRINSKVPYMIIVIDNASTMKNTIIEKYLNENTIYISAQENTGFSGGNNIGINYAISKGADYVLLLNNDTTVDVDFLDQLMKNISKCPDFGAAIGKILYYDNKEMLWYAGGSVNMSIGRVMQRGCGEIDCGQYNMSEEVGFITGCMMLIPTFVLKKIGLLDESFFLYAEDLEYSLRLTNNQYKMYYFHESKIYHKVGSSSGREEVSKNTQYYMTRNNYKAFFIYQNLLQKILNFGYNTLRYIKYIIQNRYSAEAVLNAYKDLITGKMGKR